ncbi:MAG: cytochrome c biogenesis protein ResB [Clostridia bacterium]|nr:cytochrome c biogenesis protein ResB [Clostridia bacterium]
MKKIGKFLSSMGFAVALLVILAAACALSSLVEQGLTQETYAARYGEGIASVIMALQVNDAYHSVWFIVLSGFLCLNLILCNLIRFPAFVKRWRKEKDPEAVNTAGDLGDTETGSPEQVLSAMRMPDVKRCRTAEGREALFSNRNAIGQWGAWICHLGVLLLIAGFALGQMTLQETVIWGVPGDTRIMQETGLAITIDDFRTETREDASVAQYVTEITVTDPATGKSEQASVSVNHPAVAGGFHLYQNNTGPAASASVVRDGKEIQRKTLLPQQTMAESVLGLEDQPEYAFYFAGVRTMREEGQEERTLYLYDLYRSGVLQQGYYFLGEGSVTVGEDQITFTPRTFTLLVARKDRFAWLALLGGLITLAGLALAFYLQPKALWAVRQEDGKWILRGRCRKGKTLMKEQLEEAVRAAEKEEKQVAEH